MVTTRLTMPFGKPPDCPMYSPDPRVLIHCAEIRLSRSLRRSSRTVRIRVERGGKCADIVAWLVDYSSMVKQRSLGPDNMDDGSDASSAFLDALRTRAMDDLHHAALEYGIIMKDLGAFGQGCVLFLDRD